MKKNMKFFFIFSNFLIFVSLFLSFSAQAYAKAPTIEGEWKTIDEKTGEPQSLIRIYRKGNTYFGKVAASLRKNRSKGDDICHDCVGRFHEKTVIGHDIIWGLHKKKHNLWEDGRILDPLHDKSYRVNMRLADHGQKLRVRGYIGIPLFGRTQFWERAA